MILLAIAAAAAVSASRPAYIPNEPGAPVLTVVRPGTPYEPDPHAYVAPDGRTYDQLVASHVLPDGAHPGVVNPAVTQANIKATICRSGWTATVRPPTSYTDKLRAEATPPGHKPGEGELDHRLSLEDSGHPSDPANLWWMIYADHYGARVKDVLETKLKREVCAGKITLDEARAALLGNWLVAYERYVGPLPK
jgi:hypothetical protein